MALFTPAWKGKDEKKALAQVQKFYENKQMKELFQVAKEAPAEHVRIAAANWLIRCVSDCRNWCSKYRNDPQYRSSVKKSETDARQGEEFLRLLLEQGDETVRAEAIIELSNHYMLRDYIIPAVNRLNRQDSMDKILLRGNFSVQKAVIDQIDDPETIVRLAQKGGSGKVRMLALERINDENVLMKIAAEDWSEEIGAAALNRLTLESSFAYVALNRDRSQKGKDAVGLDALDRLTSPEKIADVAAHAKNSTTRWEAVERLNDQKALRRVAVEAKDWVIRGNALAKIHNQEDLLYVIRQSPDGSTQRDAYEKMKKKGFLDEQTIAALRDEIHAPGIQEDLEMICMERSLRKRIKGKKNKEKESILRLLDHDFSSPAEVLPELEKHPDRDAIEALTLYLYHICGTDGLRGFEATRIVCGIMQRWYMDPTFDKNLLAEMRLSRYNQMKPHISDYSVNCEHSDIQLPPIIFPD